MRLLLPFLTSLAFILTPTSGFAQHDPDHSEHGFVALGEGEVHLYHLARFESPHRYQILLKVELETDAGAPLDLRSLENHHPERLWSLLTKDRYGLTDLRDGTVREFRADLYEGYLRDQAGRRLAMANVRVTVGAVEYFSEILPDAPTRSTYKMLLTCDAETGIFYGAHQVEGKPGFEEISRISQLHSSYYSPTDPNTTSVIHRCMPELQGSLLYLTYALRNQPLAPAVWNGGIMVHSAVLDDSPVATGRTILTDPAGVNR